MSISAVESRISQIVAMQQQLSDPAALASSVNSSAASSATGGASASPTNTSFSDALSSALASSTESAIDGTDSTSDGYSDPSMDSTLMSSDPSSALSALLATNGTSAAADASGVVGASGVAGTTTGTSADAPAQVQAMVNEADSLIGKPYIYGGGHSGWGPQAGYDCSGFVSAVLHAGGYLSEPQTTQGLPDQPGIESGPGQYVTIYDRNTGPTNNEHVIIEINGQFYESGGEAGAWGGGGGVEKINPPSQAYLSSFTTILHPAGL
jgi:cell wall-associated NlpC family hydrolase